MVLNQSIFDQRGLLILGPGERVMYQRDKKVSLHLEAKGIPAISCPQGTIILSNKRLVFCAAQPTTAFQSFCAPLHQLRDGELKQPLFGANYFRVTVPPLPGGFDRPAELKITFAEGGAVDLSVLYTSLLESMAQTARPPAYAPPTEAPPAYY